MTSEPALDKHLSLSHLSHLFLGKSLTKVEMSCALSTAIGIGPWEKGRKARLAKGKVGI